MKRSIRWGLTALGIAWACGVGAQAPEEAPQAAAETAVEVVAQETAAAEPPAPTSAPAKAPVRASGEATRRLLQAQAQGESASTHQYPMSGDVAQKTYERYVNSFSHPIPEQSASTIAKSGQ